MKRLTCTPKKRKVLYSNSVIVSSIEKYFDEDPYDEVIMERLRLVKLSFYILCYTVKSCPKFKDISQKCCDEHVISGFRHALDMLNEVDDIEDLKNYLSLAILSSAKDFREYNSILNELKDFDHLSCAMKDFEEQFTKIKNVVNIESLQEKYRKVFQELTAGLDKPNLLYYYEDRIHQLENAELEKKERKKKKHKKMKKAEKSEEKRQSTQNRPSEIHPQVTRRTDVASFKKDSLSQLQAPLRVEGEASFHSKSSDSIPEMNVKLPISPAIKAHASQPLRAPKSPSVCPDIPYEYLNSRIVDDSIKEGSHSNIEEFFNKCKNEDEDLPDILATLGDSPKKENRIKESNSQTVTKPGIVLHISPRKTLKKKPRRERRNFSQKEVENLINGMKRFGNSWKDILNAFEFDNRTPVDLKDKARNLRNVQ